jgi:hypothetical protein
MDLEINDVKFKCPTCSKIQQWQDNCQLCGSDVSILHNLAIKYKKLQKLLRINLRNGNFIAAYNIAQQITNIAPTKLNKKIKQFIKTKLFLNSKYKIQNSELSTD